MIPYQIPEPKDNPVSALVIFYKVCKGIQYDDRTWDKIHFSRCSKAAKEILMVCEDFETAKKCVEELADRFDSKDLTWTLETIVKNVHDWKLERGDRKNVKQARTRFLHSLNEQRANSAIAFQGNSDGPISAGALLGSLRNIGIIQPESGSQDGSGMGLRGTDNEGSRQTDLETKAARKIG